jgi:hypothetical protein
LDTLVLLVVVVGLLFVLFFSLGVEKGRSIILEKKNQGAATIKEDKNRKLLPAQEAAGGPSNKNVQIKEDVSTPGLMPSQEKETKERLAEKIQGDNYQIKYVIQVATCTNEVSAQDEAKRLQKQGFSAYTAKKNSFIVIYVGPFKKMIEAQKQQQALKKIYKDCILRTVK